MSAVRLTPPQRRGLDVLADADRDGAKVVVSNFTGVHEHGRCVYWQVADNLVAKGLAENTWSNGHASIRITDAGRGLAVAS